jgi:hypothetical protein
MRMFITHDEMSAADHTVVLWRVALTVPKVAGNREVEDVRGRQAKHR